MSRGERKAMITRDAPELSLSRQCRLLSIGRSSFYYALCLPFISSGVHQERRPVRRHW